MQRRSKTAKSTLEIRNFAVMCVGSIPARAGSGNSRQYNLNVNGFVWNSLKKRDYVRRTIWSHITFVLTFSGNPKDCPVDSMGSEVTFDLKKAVTESVESFEKTGLKPTEVVEKNLLPDANTLQEERTRSDFLKGVEGFATSGK